MENFSLKSFALGKNYVIEASAGTGKTYNIVQIVKKLVQAKEPNNAPLGLSEILIVTYTDKAAGELKDRIRKELSDEDVDNAPIYTIHSFCQNTIKEFGITANLPLTLDVIADEQLTDFANRYVREGQILRDIVAYAGVNDFDYDKLVKYLCSALKKYFLNSDFYEDPSIISLEKLPEDLCQLNITARVLENAQDFDHLPPEYSEMTKKYRLFKDFESGKERRKNKDGDDIPHFYEALEEHLNDSFQFNGNLYKNAGPWFKSLTPELQDAFIFFYNQKKALDKVGSRFYYYLVTTYLKDFYKKWQTEKETRKTQTFNDMIRYVREGVLNEKGEMLAVLRKKYRYAIIDEFQDTNQIQFDIFSKIFLSPEHNIIVVGDPKQSIYSFQGADVKVYLAAKKIIAESGGVICSLSKNYRSTKRMVDSCNRLFHHYNFPDFEDCDALDANRGEEAHDALFDGTQTEAFWVANIDGLKADDFAKIAIETIVKCCQKGPDGKTRLQVKDKSKKEYRSVTFKDFAVLAKTRSEMELIEEALRFVGIPFVRYKDTGLFGGKECADWISLLSAIDCPDFAGSNRKVFKKALFSEFFALSLGAAANEIYNAEENEPMRLIRKWRQIAYERRWEDLFDDILVESGIIERMSQLSKIQTVGIYKQISNYSIEYLSNGHSLHELLKKMQRLSEGYADDDGADASLVEKSTNFDCVQIMTMHASKGLQFPVVIAVCGFKKPMPETIITYHKQEEDEQEKHILAFKSKENEEQRKTEDIEEWKRLFYVGYTRAQFVMLLPNYEEFAEGRKFLKETLKSYLSENPNDFKLITSEEVSFSSLRKEVKVILSDASRNHIEIDDDTQKAAQNDALRRVIDLSKSAATYKHSYSSLSHSSGIGGEAKDNGETFEGLETFDSTSITAPLEMDETKQHDLLPSNYPKGPEAGTALHEVFEKIDFPNPFAEIEDLVYLSFKKQGIRLSESHIKATMQLVETVLGAKLPFVCGSKIDPEKSFTLSSIAAKDKRAEVEFNFNLENERLKNIFNGFVDLLFKKDGRYCLLDWKSDSLNEDFTSYSDNIQLKKHVDESYSIQRVLYSYCLIRWLKLQFPEMSEDDIFNRFFGGIYYVFIRGCVAGTSNGIYCQTWSSWNDLKNAFELIMSKKLRG